MNSILWSLFVLTSPLSIPLVVLIIGVVCAIIAHLCKAMLFAYLDILYYLFNINGEENS